MTTTQPTGMLDGEVIQRLNLSGDCTYLVYAFDASCSSCIAYYFDFVREIRECQYDSVVVVVCQTSDLMLLDYYADKVGVERPAKSRYICEKAGDMQKLIMDNYGVADLLVTRDEHVIYVDYSLNYEMTEEGLVCRE